MWAEKLKAAAKRIDATLYPKQKEQIEESNQLLVESYSIYKRTLPGVISKVVGINFPSKEDAQHFIDVRLKTTESYTEDGRPQVCFYEVVPQGHPLETNPFHNDKPTVITEAY